MTWKLAVDRDIWNVGYFSKMRGVAVEGLGSQQPSGTPWGGGGGGGQIWHLRTS